MHQFGRHDLGVGRYRRRIRRRDRLGSSQPCIQQEVKPNAFVNRSAPSLTEKDYLTLSVGSNELRLLYAP